MKILHAGIFKDHSLGGDIVVEKGLKKNGAEIEQFDYRSIFARFGQGGMLSLLEERLQGKDMLFIGKGELLTKEMLCHARKRGVITVLWYGDIRRSIEPWLLSLLPEIDFFFMSSGGDVLKHYFEIGKPGCAAYYFNPSDPELVSKYRKNTHPEIPIVMTASANAAADHLRNDVVKYLYHRDDVTFYGGIEQVIVNKSIYRKIGNRLIRKKPTKNIRGEEYIRVINNALIGVGANAFGGICKYASDRLTHYLEFGTFIIHSYSPGLEKIFGLNRELVTYGTVNELDEKLAKYLKDAEEREAIERAGQRKMLNEYNTENITGMMLEIIKTRKSDRFPWVEIYR